MVPTHFAVLAVFIFPHEKPAKITAEDGVGKERSHKSNRLPVVYQKDVAAVAVYCHCTSKADYQSYVIGFFLKYHLGIHIPQEAKFICHSLLC